MRKLVLALVVIVVILVVLDRVGEVEAGHVLASRIQSDENLPTRPDVSVHGFPFLTQAVGGSYSDITVDAHDVPADGITLSDIHASLHGVHVPLGDVIGGHVQRVPVDEIDGTVTVGYAAIDRYLASRHLTLAQAGTDVKVTRQVDLFGQTLAASGTGSVSVTDNEVKVSVASLQATVDGRSVSVPVDTAIAVPLSDVPFHIRAASVHPTAAGLVVTGSVRNAVLTDTGS